MATEYNNAVTLVLTLLKGNQKVTTEDIFEKVQMVKKMLIDEEPKDPIDWNKLSRDVESRCNVHIGKGSILEDKEPDHKIWLPDLKNEIEWNFWNRYKRYLEEEKGWSPAISEGIGIQTDEILGRLENPKREGAWDRRGMVVGQIQSGKTANYTGLICKAADAGYKLIIVMAGLHKSLRSQTQRRLDLEFLGFDSQILRKSSTERENCRIGVGKLLGEELLVANSLTTSADSGDFNKHIASQSAVRIGSDPILLVVKKNKSVLSNLLSWSTYFHGEKDENGVKKVSNIPILVIDDEADNASINTNTSPLDDKGRVVDEYDATAINGLIRKILNCFEQTAYVGYTATPFGNIFITPNVNSKYGDDLFPKNFIINLPVPSNYIGPSQIFGIEPDESVGIREEKKLPIIETINDFDDFMPLKHKSYHVPPYLPESLKKAVKCFILSCAARITRGQEKEHNSMLIHVTRYKDVQMRVYELVKEELDYLKRRIEYGDGGATYSLINELEEIWTNEYIEITKEVKKQINDPLLVDINWDDIKENLLFAANRIEMKLINGTAKDILDYDERTEGSNFIAIGGDKLSRGLTLEGLTISYYLRASRMYDTLMQMGRWFGFRPGYIDLCRLYTSEELVTWYKYITLANKELRTDLNYMAAINSTPEDYGLKVRTHPGELLITAVNKMRNGTPMELSYSGHVVETVVFNLDKGIVEHNFDTASLFIKDLGKYDDVTKSSNYLWKNIPSKKIIELLNNVIIHPDSRKANPSILIDYISAQLDINELKKWTVCLISNNKPDSKYNVGGHEVGLTKRQNTTEGSDKYTMANGRLLSPADEMVDLTEEQKNMAKNEMQKVTGKVPKEPSGRYIRMARPVEKGLLLIYPLGYEHSDKPVIGMSFSFPQSNNARSVKYKVNNVYWEEEFGVC